MVSVLQYSVILKKNQFELFLFRIVNNIDWYNDMSALYFINSVGRNFRLGTLLGKQSIKDRLNSKNGLSFTEFSYQIFQVAIVFGMDICTLSL